MRLLSIATAISLAVLTAGCVFTTHKLSEVGQAVTDEAIVGVWEEQSDPEFGSGGRIAIEHYTNGLYLHRDLDSGDPHSNPFRLFKIGDVTYLEEDLAECAALNGKVLVEAAKQDPNTPPGNLLPVRCERRGEWIAVWLADQTVIDRLIKDGELVGTPGVGWLGTAVITSTAVELAACLEKHSDEIYRMDDPRPLQRRIYRRVSTQVPAEVSDSKRKP
ncbi:hypothetical protein [Lacipirellula limnantheis]|uniref:Lipoprotein n=1 Tax=Lacipirellula limnantheis TaxID=2528024 RepID=A0A517TVV7_9BACT|nr:hypothetical protein [Lacipirellula limnantheis]QDT72502.1 hypothetical protein I41_16820 [Lacipirellula limnantheis]